MKTVEIKSFYIFRKGSKNRVKSGIANCSMRNFDLNFILYGELF